jgi:glycosyltransferase involved in cell wall biosynthesis
VNAAVAATVCGPSRGDRIGDLAARRVALPKQNGAMSKISAVLIVRDEAEFVDGCLRSLVGNVDEIVVVDTGSCDRTIEIASQFPISLHHFSWVNDFSAARNFALERATGDWILYIDADERLEIPRHDEYARLLMDRGKVAWKLRLHPRVGWTAYSELRLFRNDPRIRFKGVIHENIWPAVDAVARADRLDVGSCDLQLHHVGYEADQSRKNPRNIPLLRDLLSADPDHFFAWWHLGECLRLSGNDQAADETWSRGIARLREFEAERRCLPNSLLHLALIKLRRLQGAAVDDLLAEARDFFPGNLALQFISAEVAIDRGDFAAARPTLERLAAIESNNLFEPGLSYDKALFGHLSLELLALCHFRCGRFDEAARIYRVAAQTSPAPAACELKARLAQARAAA